MDYGTRLHQAIRARRAARARAVETMDPRPAARSARSPLVALQRSIGNRAVGRIQTKLKVGEPNDRLEPEADPLIQEIDIDGLTRLEAGAPGNGVAILLHEIVENFHAHAFGRDFGESHEAGLEAERRVASQLVRPGGQVTRARPQRRSCGRPRRCFSGWRGLHVRPRLPRRAREGRPSRKVGRRAA